jgi:AcrR family transcriptional regulator
VARPSVADERTRQIIDATIATIGAHGITGASLDRIAEQAGMSRGHVRHFVGNRDELLQASARRFYFQGTDGTSILPSGTDSVDAAIDYLFGPDFTEPGSDNAVVFGFVEAARTNPAIAELLTTAYGGTQTVIAELLAAEHPTATRADCDSTAYGVVAIALHNVFLSDIETSTAGTDAARGAARRLIGTLGG